MKIFSFPSSGIDRTATVTGRGSVKLSIRRVFFGSVFAGILLSSCAGLHYDQDTFRAFPYMDYANRLSDEEWQETGKNRIVASLPAVGISARVSQDPFFPDFYVFLERTQAPKLFDAMIGDILNVGGQGQLPIDPRLFSRVNQVLAFVPSSSAKLQVILIGTFGKETTRLGLMMNDKFANRFFETADHTYLQLFDAKDGSRVHVAVIGNGILAIQFDNPTDPVSIATKNFESHAIRVKSIADKGYDLVLKEYKKPTETAALDRVSDTQAEEPVKTMDVSARQAKSFASVLALELDTTRPLFSLLSFGIPDSKFVNGVRVRVEPLAGAKEVAGTLFAPSGPVNLGFEFTLHPVRPENATAVRNGIKLLLVKMAGIAGLDESVLAPIKFVENDGRVIVTGLELTEDQAAKALPALLKDLPSALSGDNSAPQ